MLTANYPLLRFKNGVTRLKCFIFISIIVTAVIPFCSMSVNCGWTELIEQILIFKNLICYRNTTYKIKGLHMLK